MGAFQVMIVCHMSALIINKFYDCQSSKDEALNITVFIKLN